MNAALNLPQRQLGYVSPLAVVDAMHYEFYQVAPSGVVFIAAPLPVTAFSSAAAAEALANATSAVDYLATRGVDRIVFGGIPVSAVYGRAAMLQLMDEQQRRVGIRVTSDFEDALEALRFSSARKVALAAKWKPTVMEAVRRYLVDAGLECLGACGAGYDARDVSTINTVESVELGVALGREALIAHPTADALLLGGGTWLSIPICATLEREFDKPVVSNMTASFWNALRQFGRTPARGLGCRLLDRAG
jgi:maleate cis-trans isomerase